MDWIFHNGGQSLIDRSAAEGHTPLNIASQYGRLESVKWLVKHNARVHLRNHGGANAVDLAIVGGHQKVLQFLVDHGGCKDDLFFNGVHTSPMSRAVAMGNKKMVKRLRKWGVPLKEPGQVYLSMSDVGLKARETMRSFGGTFKGTKQDHSKTEKYVLKKFCDFCGKEEALPSKLKKCSKCDTYYCNVHCQRQAWKQHKKDCNFFQCHGKFPRNKKTFSPFEDIHSTTGNGSSNNKDRLNKSNNSLTPDEKKQIEEQIVPPNIPCMSEMELTLLIRENRMKINMSDATMKKFAIEDQCLVHGLTSEAGKLLNGHRVTIIAAISVKHRFKCQFPDGSFKNVKPANLTAIKMESTFQQATTPSATKKYLVNRAIQSEKRLQQHINVLVTDVVTGDYHTAYKRLGLDKKTNDW